MYFYDRVQQYIRTKLINHIIRQVLRERQQGFGILVSKIPKDTNASYSLQDPSQVN